MKTNEINKESEHEIIVNETNQAILKIRDELYYQTLECAKKGNDTDLVAYLNEEYNTCDKDKLCDEVIDLLLDSFGS